MAAKERHRTQSRGAASPSQRNLTIRRRWELPASLRGEAMPDEMPDRQMGFFFRSDWERPRGIFSRKVRKVRKAVRCMGNRCMMDENGPNYRFSASRLSFCRRRKPFPFIICGGRLRGFGAQLARAGECSKTPARVSKVRTDTCTNLSPPSERAGFSNAWKGGLSSQAARGHENEKTPHFTATAILRSH